MRFQAGDAFERLLHFLDVQAGSLGDLRHFPLRQRVHEVPNDPVFDRFLPPGPLHLEHEALAQIACGDAGRIKGLDDLEDRGDLVGRLAGRKGKGVHGFVEAAAFVNVADDHLAEAALIVGQFGKAHLFEEGFLERGPRDQGIEHELPALLGFRPLADRQAALGEMVAHFLVLLHHFLEFGLEIVHGRAGGLFGGGIEEDIGGRFGQVVWIIGGAAFVAVAVLLLHFGGGDFLEHGVLLNLLLDQGLEFEGRGLQKRQRLLQLRRQHLRQRHALR